jgi:hypothetical protein
MSFHALAWAAKQKTGGLATKAVLLALANYADEHGCAYPSTAAIAAFGEMDHKTATAALDRLIAAGFIADSGDRAGHTKQIKVYRLALESLPETEAFQNRKPSSSEVKAPQKRGTDTVREPTSPKTTSSPKASAPTEAADRYHRLPADWTPTKALSAKLQAKVSEWPPGKVGDELEALHRWAANASNDKGKGRKLNWHIAWENWLDRADNDWRSKNGSVRINRGSASKSNDGFLNAIRESGERRRAANG